MLTHPVNRQCIMQRFSVKISRKVCSPITIIIETVTEIVIKELNINCCLVGSFGQELDYHGAGGCGFEP